MRWFWVLLFTANVYAERFDKLPAFVENALIQPLIRAKDENRNVRLPSRPRTDDQWKALSERYQEERRTELSLLLEYENAQSNLNRVDLLLGLRKDDFEKQQHFWITDFNPHAELIKQIAIVRGNPNHLSPEDIEKQLQILVRQIRFFKITTENEKYVLEKISLEFQTYRIGSEYLTRFKKYLPRTREIEKTLVKIKKNLEFLEQAENKVADIQKILKPAVLGVYNARLGLFIESERGRLLEKMNSMELTELDDFFEEDSYGISILTPSFQRELTQIFSDAANLAGNPTDKEYIDRCRKIYTRYENIILKIALLKGDGFVDTFKSLGHGAYGIGAGVLVYGLLHLIARFTGVGELIYDYTPIHIIRDAVGISAVAGTAYGIASIFWRNGNARSAMKLKSQQITRSLISQTQSGDELDHGPTFEQNFKTACLGVLMGDLRGGKNGR